MRKSNAKFDIVLALAVLFLIIFGLIMITSIGVPKSISLSAGDIKYPSCDMEGVDCYLLFKKHLFRLLVGSIGFFLAFKLPTKIWAKMSKFFYVGIILLLFFVLFLGDSYNTIATSWIRVFDTSVQPSELAKLVLIFYLAYWFGKQGKIIESFQDGVIPFVLVSSFIIFPVMMQNDFGSTMVLSIIAVTMFFVAGAKIKHLAIGALVALLGAVIIVNAVPHVKERFDSYSNVDEDCLRDDCWQSQQANIAVGSGGAWGRGLTQGIQKSYWLPQASDDFIFAASAEELGFLRIMFVVLAYFIILYRGFKIAEAANNQFDKYLATGITTWIAIQAFINISVNTALLPVTGITLPFVSYGGTSLVSSMIGVGILLNISKNTDYYAPSTNRRRLRRTRNTQRGRYKRA